MGIDEHEKLIDIANYKDDYDTKNFVRVEISPRNGNYLYPDDWVLKVDESFRPRWFSPNHEQCCWDAHKLWLKQLDQIVVRKKIVHPFNDVKMLKKKEITNVHIKLLKQWGSVWDSVRGSVRDSVEDSVWDSVRDSVGGSVWDSVRDSVWDSVWDSVRDSVGDSVRDSVRDSVEDSVWDSVGGSVWDSVEDSVWAYIGSFFKLSKWKYIKHLPYVYPFQSVVELWNMGLVPTFDGTKWRLHSGNYNNLRVIKAKIVFEISQKELRKYKTK